MIDCAIGKIGGHLLPVLRVNTGYGFDQKRTEKDQTPSVFQPKRVDPWRLRDAESLKKEFP